MTARRVPPAGDPAGGLPRLRAAKPTEPDRVEWAGSGQTIAAHWQGLTVAGRRDWLRDEAGWNMVAVPGPGGGWQLDYYASPEWLKRLAPEHRVTFLDWAGNYREARPASIPCVPRTRGGGPTSSPVCAFARLHSPHARG